MNKNIILLSAIFLCFTINAQSQEAAAKPLFADPIYDGAADPVIIWNNKEKKWWMFYTNRRANIEDTTGVKWVHGTRIGIAQSKDGRTWKYKDTANISYFPAHLYDKNFNTLNSSRLASSAGEGPGVRTFWAPDVIEHDGTYHMYLTYVPGIFSSWNHPRNIVHLTSEDLINWKYESQLNLVNNKVIDACVFQLPDGTWRMWYNNEMDGKSIWYADSKDLYHWVDKGKAIAARGEGPKVFQWQNKYWMIVDVWKGMEIYQSANLLSWKKQTTRNLEEGGTGKDDGAIGGHADVLVNNNKAYLFYFTHPGRTKNNPARNNSYEAKRSVIQLAELEVKDGEIVCDRNQPTTIKLKSHK
ncbi:MAG: family 43 glycosylhydrolase [Bacteroidota bacterium]